MRASCADRPSGRSLSSSSPVVLSGRRLRSCTPLLCPSALASQVLTFPVLSEHQMCTVVFALRTFCWLQKRHKGSGEVCADLMLRTRLRDSARSLVRSPGLSLRRSPLNYSFFMASMGPICILRGSAASRRPKGHVKYRVSSPGCSRRGQKRLGPMRMGSAAAQGCYKGSLRNEISGFLVRTLHSIATVPAV